MLLRLLQNFITTCLRYLKRKTRYQKAIPALKANIDSNLHIPVPTCKKWINIYLRYIKLRGIIKWKLLVFKVYLIAFLLHLYN